MGGSKTSTSTQTNNSTKTPWDASAGFFPDVYSRGASAVASNQSLPIPQNFVAGANPTEQSAVQSIINAAPGLGAAAPNLSDMAKKIAGGYFLNPQNDPTFAGATSAAITPVLQNVREKLLPQVINSSITGGGTGGGPSAYGGANAGSAADIENERVIRDFGQTAGNITASMANASRTAGMNLIPQAGNIAAAGDTEALAPSVALGQAGTQQQTYAQQDINNILQQYQAQASAPWMGLQPFANLLTTGGFYNGTSNTTGTQTTPAPDLATQLLQGGLGAAGIGSSLFMPGTGGVSAAGNIFSGLRGLFAGQQPMGSNVNDTRNGGIGSA